MAQFSNVGFLVPLTCRRASLEPSCSLVCQILARDSEGIVWGVPETYLNPLCSSRVFLALAVAIFFRRPSPHRKRSESQFWWMSHVSPYLFAGFRNLQTWSTLKSIPVFNGSLLEMVNPKKGSCFLSYHGHRATRDLPAPCAQATCKDLLWCRIPCMCQGCWQGVV